MRLFKVEKVINLNVYKLKLFKQYSRTHLTFYVFLLISYKKQSDIKLSDLIIIENIEEYIAKHMLDACVKQSKHQYLVKWEDYNIIKNIWELIFNLKNAAKMVQKFKEAQAARSKLLAKSIYKACEIKR